MVVVASYRPPLTGPKAVMPHQDTAGGHSKPMGLQPKKVDFQGNPKVSQMPDFFVNTPPKLNFLLGPCLCQAGPYCHLCTKIRFIKYVAIVFNATGYFLGYCV